MPPTTPPLLDPETEHKLAAGLYNEVWRLMELESRTAQDTDAMIHAAHASRHHWSRVGTQVNLARGEWLCSRVYAVLGRGEPSLWHARRCLAILQELEAAGAGAPTGEPGAPGGLAVPAAEDWDIAAAYEALARASRLAGDEAAASDWLALAREAVSAIADPRDRAHIESDLAGMG
jgi:hypothetical protein